MDLDTLREIRIRKDSEFLKGSTHPPHLKIAVDLDDVVVQFWPTVVSTYNKEFGESLTLEEQAGWDDNPIKNSHHFGKGKAYKSWWDWWRDRHWLWATCDAVPGAIGALAELRKQGHYIELLTSKPDWARRETTKWLARWHPAFDQLTFVQQHEVKAEKSDADVLIDDKPDNIQHWAASGRAAILFRRPWNSSASARMFPGVVLCAETWAGVTAQIHYIMRRRATHG